MKVFVTGGAGFIGSHLCEYLVKRGDSVTAYDNLVLGQRKFIAHLETHPNFKFFHADLLSDKDLSEHLRGHDLVFHLAANSDISLGAKNTDLDLRQNTLATYQLLEAMRVAGLKQVIFSSTSAVYGEATVKPTPESYGPLIPISFYGASKLGAEAVAYAFAHHYGIQAWVYRFANVVGQNLTHGAIFDFVHRLTENPRELTVLGDGTQRKAYLHVSDCIEGMLHGYKTGKFEVNIFNLASTGVSTVRFIAEEVVRQMGGTATLKFGTEDRGWKGDVPYTHIATDKLDALGWKAKIDSDEAVRRSISEVLQCMRKP